MNYIDINTFFRLHSKYSDCRICCEYIINYSIKVEVNHYLNFIDINLLNWQYTNYNKISNTLQNIVDIFDPIGIVHIDKENSNIKICLDIFKIFLQQNKLINVYYRFYSNDKEEVVNTDINSIINIGIDSQNIYTDIDGDKNNLTKLVSDSKEGEVIYFFSISRSSNNFEELVSIIFFLREKNVDLFIEDIYFSPYLEREQLFNILKELKFLYESRQKSLKIKKGQENVYIQDDKQIGRPKAGLYDLPSYVFDNYKLLAKGDINMTQFAEICDVSRPTAYKYKKMIEENNENQ